MSSRVTALILAEANPAELLRASWLLLALAIGGAVLVVAVASVTIHRWRRTSSRSDRRGSSSGLDPWAEAGRRLDDGYNPDDTVDLDPSDLNPDDVTPDDDPF